MLTNARLLFICTLVVTCGLIAAISKSATPDRGGGLGLGEPEFSSVMARVFTVSPRPPTINYQSTTVVRFSTVSPPPFVPEFKWVTSRTFTVEVDGVLGDLNGDGVVDVSDLLILLGAWGPCAECSDCPADLNADCAVDVSDLLILLGNWG